MTERETRFQDMVEAMQAGGNRLTPQRLALVKLLAESEHHPSAAQLYAELRQQFPTTSLATVYKTLHLLSDLGEVQEMDIGQGEHRFDGYHGGSHPHLICVQCHVVTDAPVDHAEIWAREVARVSGYRILAHRVEFYGLCPDCQAGA